MQDPREQPLEAGNVKERSDKEGSGLVLDLSRLAWDRGSDFSLDLASQAPQS